MAESVARDRIQHSARRVRDLRTTVLVPTYNRAVLLSECLDALLAQTLAPAEIIVIDDGSSDRTPEVVRQKHGPIRVISQANRGKSAALNLGLEAAEMPFIWIMDDDDIAAPDALERLTALIARSPDADFAYGRHDRFRRSPETGETTFLSTGYWTDCTPQNFLIATLEDFFVHQPAMLVSRELYRRVGWFDEGLSRSLDYEMLVRLARAGTVVATDDVLFHQRLHDGVRGPRGQAIDACDRDASWLANDRAIFERLHARLPLADYTPGRRIKGACDTRGALIQRGAIMARKTLWHLALDDFEAAAAILPARRLSDDEHRTIRRALHSKYGCGEVLAHRSLTGRVRSLAAGGPAGRDIAQALARGLVWRIRENVRPGALLTAVRFAGKAAAWRWIAASSTIGPWTRSGTCSSQRERASRS